MTTQTSNNLNHVQWDGRTNCSSEKKTLQIDNEVQIVECNYYVIPEDLEKQQNKKLPKKTIFLTNV